jgi:hypothetical protein
LGHRVLESEPPLIARIWEFVWAVLWNWRSLVAFLSLASGFAPKLLPLNARKWLDNHVRPELSRWVLIVISLVFLFIAVFQAYDDISVRLRQALLTDVKMQITNVLFDPNDPTAFNIIFTLANGGTPTTVKNWKLSIFRDNHELANNWPPKDMYRIKWNFFSSKLDPPDDLSKRPLNTGEEIMEDGFRWAFQGNAMDEFALAGTKFHLVADDIKGRSIAADYYLP